MICAVCARQVPKGKARSTLGTVVHAPVAHVRYYAGRAVACWAFAGTTPHQRDRLFKKLLEEIELW